MELFMAILAIGGLIAVDTTGGPQILFSEPLVSCTILGMLMGDIHTGMIFGIFFQLLRLGYRPLGAAQILDSNMAAYIAAAAVLITADIRGFTATETRAAVFLSLPFSVIIGTMGMRLTDLERKLNGIRSERFIAKFEAGKSPSLRVCHFMGLLSSFIRGYLMCTVFIPLGIIIFRTIPRFHEIFKSQLADASIIIWGLVFASAIYLCWFKGLKRYILLGLTGGVVWTLIRAI